MFVKFSLYVVHVTVMFVKFSLCVVPITAILVKFNLYVVHATGMFVKFRLYVVNIRNRFAVFVFWIINIWRWLLLAGRVKILLGCEHYTFVKWHLMWCDHHIFHLSAVHLSINSRKYLQKAPKSALPHFPMCFWIINYFFAELVCTAVKTRWTKEICHCTELTTSVTWWIKNNLLSLIFEHANTITLFKWYEKVPKCMFSSFFC